MSLRVKRSAIQTSHQNPLHGGFFVVKFQLVNPFPFQTEKGSARNARPVRVFYFQECLLYFVLPRRYPISTVVRAPVIGRGLGRLARTTVDFLLEIP